MWKTLSLLLPLFVSTSVLICAMGCGDDAEKESGDPGVTSDWDSLDWIPIASSADPVSDCTSADVDCQADLTDMALATAEGLLYVEVTFAAAPPSHWYEADPPASLAWRWIAPERFGALAAVSDLGLDGLGVLKVGVGAAPGDVEVSADYTDRHPDALWITSQDVLGLAEVVIHLA